MMGARRPEKLDFGLGDSNASLDPSEPPGGDALSSALASLGRGSWANLLVTFTCWR